MSRDLTTDLTNAISTTPVKPVILAKLEFASGTVRLHSGVGNLTFNAETYTGVGTLGSVSTLVESTNGSSNGATLTLCASSSVIALILTDVGSGRNRPAKVWIGAKNLSTDALIADPAERYSGFISHATHNDNSVSIILNDETGDQTRSKERRYTMEDQLRIDPTDTSMRYVADLPNKQFNWGNAKVYTGGGSNDNSNGGGDQTSDIE